MADIEAEKFFNYYESVGWKKGNNPIENWQAAAESWMLKATDFKISKKSKKKSNENDPNALPLDHFQDNLQVNQNKRYDIPL